MREVKQIFEKLQATNSKIEKQRIIGDNKSMINNKFCETLKFLLSPYVLTGISNKKIDKSVPTIDSKISSWEDMVTYLKEHNTGTDKDIAVVQSFINSQENDMREFYKGLITKSIKLGCDAKIINEVVPDLIPAFNVQLGTSIEKVKLKGDEHIFISRKLNGNRCVYYKGQLISRQGKVFTGLEHIIKDIGILNIDNNYVLDGELIGKNEEGLSDSENFQKSTGLANSKDSDKSSLKLVVFDIINIEDFEKGVSKNTYSERKKLLIEYNKSMINLKNIEIVEMMYDGYDHNKIWEMLDRAESLDYEGVVVNLDKPYVCKRTKDLIKVKKFFDTDLRCVAVNKAETGKYKDTLGAITCKYKDGTVDVGSGFTDEQRDYYFNNPNEIVEKIVTVKYKEVTHNKNGGESLQFPVFITVRQDKDIADDEI